MDATENKDKKTQRLTQNDKWPTTTIIISVIIERVKMKS